MNVPIPFFAASRKSSGISAPRNARTLRLSPSSRRNRLLRASRPVDVLHVGVESARAVDMFHTLTLASASDDLAPSTPARARPQRSLSRRASPRLAVASLDAGLGLTTPRDRSIGSTARFHFFQFLSTEMGGIRDDE